MVALSDSDGKAPENNPLEVEYSVIDPKSQVARKENTSERQSIPPKLGNNNYLYRGSFLSGGNSDILRN